MNFSEELVKIDEDLKVTEECIIDATFLARLFKNKLEEVSEACLGYHDELIDAIVELLELGNDELEEAVCHFKSLLRNYNKPGETKVADRDERPQSQPLPGPSTTCTPSSITPVTLTPVKQVDNPMGGGNTSAGGQISTQSTIQPLPRPIKAQSPAKMVGQMSSCGMATRKHRANAPRGGGRAYPPPQKPRSGMFEGSPEKIRLSKMVDDDWEKDTIEKKPLAPPKDNKLVLYRGGDYFEGKKAGVKFTQLPN